MYRIRKKIRKPKIQNIRNLFILKKNKEIKNRTIRDIWKLFEIEEEKKRKKVIRDTKNIRKINLRC